MTHAFHVGQRVRTTVDARAAAAVAGTLGTITVGLDQVGRYYGVLLDGDPNAIPVAFTADELTAVDD